MTSCWLTAAGKNFDVDQFLRKTKLKECFVFKRGERITKHKTCQKSGVKIAVSHAGFHQFEQQVKDAEKFLRKHQVALKKLTFLSGVESVVLDFGINNKNWKDFPIQCHFLPATFLRLVTRAKIDIKFSLYSL